MKEYSLEEISVGIYDGPHATPKESEEGPIFLGIKNVTVDGRLDFTTIRHISEQEFPKWTKRVQPQENDIVFSYEATLHRYALIPKEFRGCLGRRMALIRSKPKIVNSTYLLYFFLSDNWKRISESVKITGATVDRFLISKLPDVRILLPPLQTQNKIASILSTYDELIENNQRRIALLEESARLLYREWFVHLRFPGHEHTKIVDGVPEGWRKTTADNVMQILSGGTPKTKIQEYWDGEIGFYTPKDSTNTVFVSRTEKRLTEEGLKNCSSKLYPKNTVFITARGTVGKLNLAQKPMAMNQSCYALIAEKPMTQAFLYFALQAGIQQFKSRAVGAVFDAIIKDTFKLIPFVIPSRNLMQLYSEFVDPILDQIDNLLITIEKLTESRDILLPRLMNGEIRV